MRTKFMNIISDKRVSILDDNIEFAKKLKLEIVRREIKAEVYCFDNVDLFLRVHKETPFDICIFDLKDNSKIKNILPEIRKHSPTGRIIFIDENTSNSICIMKNGSSARKLISEINDKIVKIERKTPIELSILSSLTLLNIEKHNLKLQTG